MNENIKLISKSVGISLLTTIVLLFIFSILLTYTNLSENIISPVIIIISAISIFIRKFTG